MLVVVHLWIHDHLVNVKVILVSVVFNYCCGNGSVLVCICECFESVRVTHLDTSNKPFDQHPSDASRFSALSIFLSELAHVDGIGEIPQ